MDGLVWEGVLRSQVLKISQPQGPTGGEKCEKQQSVISMWLGLELFEVRPNGSRHDLGRTAQRSLSNDNSPRRKNKTGI